MAGESVIDGELTQYDVDELASCGLALDVVVDCSHNRYFRTMRADRPAEPVMAKPIEVRGTLGPPDDPDATYQLMCAHLRASPRGSLPFLVHQYYQRQLARPGRDGLHELQRNGLRMVFPWFHRSILDLGGLLPGTPLARAVQACEARTPDDFIALPEEVRGAMGIYQRDPFTRTFSLRGPPEPGPRAPAPDLVCLADAPIPSADLEPPV